MELEEECWRSRQVCKLASGMAPDKVSMRSERFDQLLILAKERILSDLKHD